LLRGRRLHATARLLARNVRALGALASERKVALVHANTSVVLCGQAVADGVGVPHVSSVREIYRGMAGRAGAVLWPLLKRRLLRADGLACSSQAVAAQFAGSPGAFVLYDAVPREFELPPRAAARRALGLPADSFVAA